MTEESVAFTFAWATYGQGSGKVADATLHFLDGPLAGLRLEGFSIWRSKFEDRGEFNLMVPARPGKPKPDGKKTYYDILRADGDEKRALYAFKDFALAAFADWRANGAPAQATSRAPSPAQGFAQGEDSDPDIPF